MHTPTYTCGTSEHAESAHLLVNALSTPWYWSRSCRTTIMRVSVLPERLSGPSGPHGPRAAREPRSRDMRALHGGSEHNAATERRRQLEEEGDLDPRDDSGDGGATCRRCTRSKATFKDSKTFVGERGHVVVTAPAQELTRRARQQSARWKCSGRGQEAGMLGPRGENPRASTAEVRGARTIMRASTQESAFARERRGAPSALSNELFHDRNRGMVLPTHCLTVYPHTRVNKKTNGPTWREASGTTQVRSTNEQNQTDRIRHR